MKKIAVISTIIFSASLSNATVYTVSLTAKHSYADVNDYVQFGTGESRSNTLGTYNSETKVLSFSAGSIDSTHMLSVWGDKADTKTVSNLSINFSKGEGEAITTSCVTGEYNALGAGNFACSASTGKALLKNLKYTVDLENPFAASKSFSFKAYAYNGLVQSYHTYTVSQVPVPAAAWLFGSALLGLRAFCKR